MKAVNCVVTFMRTTLLALLFVANLAALAQPAGRLRLGAVADLRLAMFNPTDGLGEQYYHPATTFGGGAGLAWTVDLMSRLTLSGYVQPFVFEKTKVESNGSITPDPFDPMLWRGSRSTSSAWSEFSSALLFKPLKKEAYALLIGTGFSARWSGMVDTGTENTSGYLYHWNFHLPIQAGVEFEIDSRWRVMCLAEYQFGLREAYHIYERAFKINTVSLKLITLWATRSETTYK
jgi:hypothetical protein